MTANYRMEEFTRPEVPEWDRDQVEDSRVFRTSVQKTNLRGLIFCGAIALSFYPLFWLLDLYVTPRWIVETFMIRVSVSLYSFVVVAGALIGASWVRENTGVLGAVLVLFAGLGIATMCWLGGGLESKYYAGLNLVFIATVIFFTFTPPVTYGIIWGMYLIYITPWFLLGMPVEEPVVLINNQFFLFGALIICTVGYHFRYQLVLDEARRRLEQRELMRKFRRMAHYDNLTGLKNRGYWLQEMHETNGRTAGGKVFSEQRPDRWIVMIDIDHFKRVNDRYGHQAGDRVLNDLADIFREEIRPGDSIARFGGEEFILELNDTFDGEAVAERLREKIAVSQFRYNGRTIPLTVSMGVASWERDKNLRDAISEADRALYEAKEAGRNQVKTAESVA